MANKRFWLGMLVLALVFGMTVVGCDEYGEQPDGEVELTNNTLFDITQVVFETNAGVIKKNDTSGIASTKKKTYKFSSDFEGKCIVTVALGSESVTVEKKYVSTDRGSTQFITLKGISKETLTFGNFIDPSLLE